ncbi:MAG: hypothetical protein ACREPT_05780 [Rudaea sp.]
MRFCTVLILAGTLSVLPGLATADQASEAALEARVKALEQHIAELEARLNVVASRQAPPPSAAGAAGSPAMAATAPPAATVAAAPPPRWTDSANWDAMKVGLGWSQVKALLGNAGRVTTGVFGDVWYYPDDSGGRVIFDRDGRVSEWNAPGH